MSRPGRAPRPGARERRCGWCGDDPEYRRYHDEEWGFPPADDHRLYEKICLEGFQAGLSWLTILKKRPAFREVFADFDPEAVARFGTRDIARLLKDRRIVRHRGKIEAAINNATRALEVRAEFGSLAVYFWRFEPPAGNRPRRLTPEVVAGLTATAESKALSADLKRRGFAFVGPTTCYAFMQSVGIVNDHEHTCAARAPCERARVQFKASI